MYLTLDFGTLPGVQQALRDLPATPDAEGVTAALREALVRDLGRQLTPDQIETAALLYTEALAAVAQALAQVGDRDGLSRALAAVARAMAQVTRPEEAEAISWLHTAFRAARARGRDEVWRHIGAFAPLLGKLGVLPAAWERIHAVEEVRAYGPAPSPR